MATLDTRGVYSGSLRMSDYQSVGFPSAETVDGRVPWYKRCKCCKVQGTPLLEHVGLFCAVAVSAYIGALIRVYLKYLNRWDGMPYFPSFYSQVIGSFILGIVASHKLTIEKRSKLLFVALATGLCGSITTFSSWNNEAINVLLNVTKQDPDERKIVYSDAGMIIGWFTILIVGFGMPVASLVFGKGLGNASPLSDMKILARRAHASDVGASTPPVVNQTSFCEVCTAIVIWVLVTALLVTLFSLYKEYELLFVCLFGMIGAYIRWLFSPLNKCCCPNHFKMGTFIVNVLGSWIQGGARVALRLYVEGVIVIKEAAAVGALEGVIYGFCSCLTTVSTFAGELVALPLSAAIVYGISSIFCAQFGILLIRGPIRWLRISEGA